MAKVPSVNKPGSTVVVAPAPKTAKPVHPADQETFEVEQENHNRALASVENTPLPTKSVTEEDEHRARALAYNEQIRGRSVLPNENQLNARPGNWSIKDSGGGDISATNYVTGATYEGPRSGFLK